MPTYKQFGLSNYVGSVANIGSGVGYWTMTYPVGSPSPGTIEIDFGYPVELKSIAWVKSQGYLGRWDIVGSNTPATSTADVYVPANGDLRNSGWIDDLGLVFYRAGFTTAFRYYRLLLLGDATLPGSGMPSLGSDSDPNPYFHDHRLTDIICNVSMVATAFGYTTQSGTPANVVDRNGATSWTPYATTWPPSTPAVSPPTAITATPSSADTYPALQIDMGEAVAVTKFKFVAFHAASLGAAMLYASNNPASSLSNTIQVGDVRIGSYTAAELCSGVDLDTDLKTSGQPFRYYRFISTRGVGPGPDGTAVSSFTPSFFPPVTNPTITWNPADKTTNIALSNANMTASLSTVSFLNEGVRSTGPAKSTGKWYLEFTNILSGSAGSGGRYGFAAAGDTLGGAGQCGVHPDGNVSGPIGGASMGSAPDGHTLGLAIDLDHMKLWARYDAGSWNNVGTDNPATNNGGLDITGVTLPLYVHLWEQAFHAGHATLNVGATAFVQAIPSGFSAWQEPNSYHAFFTDDGGLEDIVMSLTPAGPAYLVRFNDGGSDALVANVTITQNPVLSVAFTDDAELDAFSDIFPSTVVQTMVYTTGR